ncbi:hypothetical protein FQR65_LT02066 [Abscondita terminalis]|nr:hypothetical protein FQR65_LT02066 [Abscondita terminalis]
MGRRDFKYQAYESSHQSDSGSGYWQLELDRDLVDTIAAIYPEWFKNNTMAEGGPAATSRDSPPKAIVDTTPLLNTLEQNKESLKVKLMLRRPFDQLVAQGIMPPHKTPAAFHGQRRQLERAKTGDILKAKIQQRPSRQELERRHILDEDPGHVDPSLAERQRMLKKARLADQLNDQLSHRPGPLELIQKNILHTEEPIENAVKSGRIPYKATCEGQLNRPQHPQSYMSLEDDSQSSEGDAALVSPGPSDVIETAAKSAGIVVSLIPATEGAVVVTTATPVFNKDNSEIVFADLSRSVGAPILSLGPASSPASLVSSTSTLSPLSSIASPVPQPSTPIPPPLPVCLTPRPTPSPTKSDAPGKEKNRKKSKSKSAPKTRTIKFHEYKGPPSAQKNSTANSSNPGESSYDLLLQQQTLLLQFQLQLQHKYPQIILPASQKTGNESPSSVNPQTPSSVVPPAESPGQSKLIGRLEDMKVSDLKAELKRRSLPVSGSKPQLIERLKPFTGSCDSVSNQSGASNLDNIIPNNTNSNEFQSSFKQEDVGSPNSVSVEDSMQEKMDILEPTSPLSPSSVLQLPSNKDDIVREQQRQIEELQRELTISQLKLQAATRAEPKAQLIALQKHLQARQQNQQLAVHMQQLQALQAQQAQEQQRIQQQQHVAFQNQKNLAGGLLLNGNDATTVLNHLVQGKAKFINGHSRANSLPNFINTIVAPIINTPDIKMECNEEVKPPPPLYEEATKQIKKDKNYVKSQIVDDVLEILIKNGELPPSAAQDPSTPGSAGTKATEPIFPNNVPQPSVVQPTMDAGSPEAALGLDVTDLLDTLDTLENMDFSQLVMELGGNQQAGEHCVQNTDMDNMSVPMDTDDWLESLLPSENQNGNMTNQHTSQESELSGYDPLLATVQDPFDPFSLEEFRSTADLTAALSWDKVDFAA